MTHISIPIWTVLEDAAIADLRETLVLRHVWPWSIRAARRRETIAAARHAIARIRDYRANALQEAS